MKQDIGILVYYEIPLSSIIPNIRRICKTSGLIIKLPLSCYIKQFHALLYLQVLLLSWGFISISHVIMA